MDNEEKVKLKRQYESLSDFQLEQMLSDGRDAYVEGAYDLLQAEAARRGLDQGKPPQPEEEPAEPREQPSGEQPIDVNTYVQLVIVNSAVDREFIDSALQRTGIAYYFQNLHVRNLDLPVGLMVDQPRFEDAIELLRGFHPADSIILW